jgi:hypothetical protein
MVVKRKYRTDGKRLDMRQTNQVIGGHYQWQEEAVPEKFES